jgi:hypothetical protein
MGWGGVMIACAHGMQHLPPLTWQQLASLVNQVAAECSWDTEPEHVLRMTWELIEEAAFHPVTLPTGSDTNHPLTAPTSCGLQRTVTVRGRCEPPATMGD